MSTAVSCRRDDRGALAIVIAVVSTLILLPLAALAVDIGSQRAARRDMQAIADTVALDMAAALAANDATNQPVTDAAATTDADRNSGALGNGTTVHVYKGYVASGATVPSNQGRGCGSSPYDPTYFQDPNVAGQTANAVLVTASTRVRFGLTGRSPASGGACRSSLATAIPTACFSIGSYAARISATNAPLLRSLLNGTPAGDLGVTAVGYQGLATANVALDALATALSVGTPEQLATTTVSVQNLVLAEAGVLRDNGDVVNADLLQNTVATKVGMLGTINLGSLLGVSSGSGSVAAASVNALDLLAGAVFLANGTNVLSIPSLATNLGVVSATSTVKLIEGAVEACGAVGTQASTSQADVLINGDLASVATPSSLTGLSFSPGSSPSTSIAAHLASATGTLTGITCGAGTSTSRQGIDVSVASQLASVTVAQKLNVSGQITASGLLSGLLGSLLGNIVEIDVAGSVQLGASLGANGGTTSALSFRLPPDAYDVAKSTGSGGIGAASLTTSVADASGLTIKAYSPLLNVFGVQVGLQQVTLSAAQQLDIVSSLTASLNPLLTNLMSGPVTQLSQLLGLELSGADVYDRRLTTCTSGQLIG